MGKRKTIKPVKAWGFVRAGGALAVSKLTGRVYAYENKIRAADMADKGETVVRVTVSVDDLAATRISAAQRRVDQRAYRDAIIEEIASGYEGAALHRADEIARDIRALKSGSSVRAKGGRK